MLRGIQRALRGMVSWTSEARHMDVLAGWRETGISRESAKGDGITFAYRFDPAVLRLAR